VCVCVTKKIVGACVNERERKRKIMLWYGDVCVCARETLCAGCTCESVCGLLDVLKKCECVYRREWKWGRVCCSVCANGRESVCMWEREWVDERARESYACLCVSKLERKSMCVLVYVCVCERERERKWIERWNSSLKFYFFSMIFHQKSKIIQRLWNFDFAEENYPS
jgi:hypothetical protein